MTAIGNIGAIPMHTYGYDGKDAAHSWTYKGVEIKQKMYGTSDEEISDTAALYAIMNAKMGNTYVWQPKGGYKDDEKSKLDSDKITMMQVMANHNVIISVEPIIWTKLRDDNGSSGIWTNIAIYGTHTDIGYACKDQMIPAGILSGGQKDYGGWDVDLVARGRKALVTTKALTFESAGLTVNPPTVTSNEQKISNAEVTNKSIGWSLHLYRLNPKEDEPDIPTTSTCDEPDHPIEGNPPKRKPHPSQDPYEPENPGFDPETTPVKHGEDPYTHYRIVKCYETEKYKSDGVSLLERKSDGLFTTEPTNPIVDIEDEKASDDEFDGSWHLKDWDVSDDYKPPLPDLWEPLTKTYTSKQHGTTEADGISLIDENDEEKVVTLYVHLLRKVKEDKPEEEEETGGTGNIIIQQSQISKTIHTNDKGIGGIWGNYTFKTQPAANFTKKHTTYKDHCCAPGHGTKWHTCYCC